MPVNNSLMDLYNQINKPPEQSGHKRYFSVVSIPGKTNIKLGRDRNNAPCVLIQTNDGSTKDNIAPLLLENIKIEFNLECLVYLQDGKIEKSNFCVIICREKNPFIVDYFFKVMVSIIDLIGETASVIDVHDILLVAVDLFRSLLQPPIKSTQGLWAELFVICRSSNPQVLIEAWHATPEDRYDFCSGNMRIEIKSSSQRVRNHRFSLEQLNPPPNTMLLIASLYVERAGGGTSINDLLENISIRIHRQPKMILKIEKIISQTLGTSLQNGLVEKFDYELAENSLAFYDYKSIPTIDSHLPAGVSGVQFSSDFSKRQSIDLPSYTSFGGLFENAIIPKKR